ncbi:thiolase family protein [Rhodococcus gannanensis]|uniref:Thiolase family protein n=1 Tax=Rhodococcus gannanensis TaxID=1960308 RepID=A0ABW4P4U2_9NOCA
MSRTRAAVVGVGYSTIHREKGVDVRPLVVDACRAAISDAGLAVRDVEGIFEYAGDEGAQDIQRMLGIENLATYADYTARCPSAITAALGAEMAVLSGACEVALVVRSVTREWGTMSGQRLPTAAGPAQFELPYGVMGGVIPVMGMRKQRRLAEFGGTEDQYAHVTVGARKWSALNERAVLRDPVTADDYFGSRFVAEPLRLLDCDYPVTGACAVVVTTAERAADLAQPTVLIDASSMGTGRRADWTYTPDFVFGGTQACADTMWRKSTVTPADVDVAELYDGFTHIAISWTEALGFCGPGEFGDWVDKGDTIGPGGALPLNTTGGQLAEGRLHGLSFLAEAVLQLRGQAGVRQVPGARVSVVANGFGPQCASMVLTR